MVPPPLSSSVPPQSLTTPSPSPSSTPLPDLGLCGLTDQQWHLVIILGVCFLIAFVGVVIVAWINSVGIPSLWLMAQERAEVTRMELREKLFGHLLSENDVRILTPGAAITPRRYHIVDFVLAPLLPTVQRGSA